MHSNLPFLLLLAVLPACLPPLSVMVGCSGAFIGLIGSVAFWPLAVYFPIKMYAKVHPPQPLQRAIMLLVNVLTAALSLGAAAGSIADLVQSAKQFNLGGF